MVIRPFILWCKMTDQEKPSFSTLSFILSLTLASHLFKTLVSTVATKIRVVLVPKEMRPHMQPDCLIFLITWELVDQF